MSLKAMVWGKPTGHAANPLYRLVLMQRGDVARREDYTGVVIYRASTRLGMLAKLAFTDEAAVRACPGGLAERGAIITPAGYREHGGAELAFDLAVGR
ncbi:hypothetical protein [Actinoplanes sp. ATCC 53533]|uniref:hypothetical protein n=1 Tax=Actinoplanes sp. ATCC 53533 TaxID=1288362 RepID=UPI000F79A09C|nr:hypothetical protein [Actinoplanes sp. ATCC 53533]